MSNKSGINVDIEMEIDSFREPFLPDDFKHCKTREELRREIIEGITPSWRAFPDDDDVNALWEAVQKVRKTVSWSEKTVGEIMIASMNQ